MTAQASGGGPCNGPFRFGPGRVDNPCDSYHFWSYHTADASAKYLAYSAEPIMAALGTMRGGEVVTLPD